MRRPLKLVSDSPHLCTIFYWQVGSVLADSEMLGAYCKAQLLQLTRMRYGTLTYLLRRGERLAQTMVGSEQQIRQQPECRQVYRNLLRVWHRRRCIGRPSNAHLMDLLFDRGEFIGSRPAMGQ